jgi:hypothetical protein
MKFTLRDWTLLLLGLILTLLVVGLNNWLNKTKVPRFATVDIRAIMGAKQKQVGAVLLKPSVTEEARKAALESASAYGNKVDVALNEILQECHCVLVSKELVVAGSSARDYTPTILEKLADELKPLAP